MLVSGFTHVTLTHLLVGVNVRSKFKVSFWL